MKSLTLYPSDYARLADLFVEARASRCSDETAMRVAIERLAAERNEISPHAAAMVAVIEQAVGLERGALARRTREFEAKRPDSGSTFGFVTGSSRAVAYWLLHQELEVKEIAAAIGRSYNGVWQTLQRFGKRLLVDVALQAKVARAKARLRDLERKPATERKAA